MCVGSVCMCVQSLVCGCEFACVCIFVHISHVCMLPASVSVGARARMCVCTYKCVYIMVYGCV